ncbi:uncharacterized protein DS421_12g375200 [Arachis hypogaea]|nr:uncharacterized protein DS421_12g375200 [Arachis hypogaea]
MIIGFICSVFFFLISHMPSQISSSYSFFLVFYQLLCIRHKRKVVISYVFVTYRENPVYINFYIVIKSCSIIIITLVLMFRPYETLQYI